MKTILLPDKETWNELCKRPVIERNDLENKVRDILNSVKSKTDSAVCYYTEKFDGVTPGNLKVSPNEISESAIMIPQELRDAINVAKKILKLSILPNFSKNGLWKHP